MQLQQLAVLLFRPVGGEKQKQLSSTACSSSSSSMHAVKESVGDDGRAVGSDCTRTEEEEEEKGFGQRKYYLWHTEEEKWGEMNDEALHYAMIGGRPKEKQQGIEYQQQPLAGWLHRLVVHSSLPATC
jgi:hypothetical protein